MNRIYSILIMAGRVFFAVLMLIADKGYGYPDRDVDFTTTCRITQKYDDNITYISQNEKSDFLTELSVGMNMRQEGKIRRFTVDGMLIQQVFAEYHRFNNTKVNLNAVFAKEKSRFERYEVKNSFVHAEEPGTFEDEFGRTSGRYRYLRNTFAYRHERDMSVEVTIFGRGSMQIYEVSSAGPGGALQASFGGGMNYRLNTAASIPLTYDFTRTDYALGADVNQHTFRSGVSRRFTKQLTLDVRAGLDVIESGFTDEWFLRPLFSCALNNEIDAVTYFFAAAETRYSPLLTSADVFQYRKMSAGLSRQLLRRLHGTVSGFLGRGRFTAAGISDYQQGISVKVSYDVLKKFRAECSYAHSNVDSTDSRREYTKNVVAAGAVLNF